jgi:hypothetical protein
MSGAVENPFAGQGSVLLDIGGDVGAVVVTMPADLLGTEVEIWPVGGGGSGHSHHPHVAVVNRPAGGTRIPSLVFPELLEGRYELHRKGSPGVARLTVDVRGGEVTTLTWPS